MNWIDSTVGKFCPFIYGKGLPQSNRKAGNVPVYGSNGCVDYHDESYVKPHGIIIGRKGSVGAIHLCEEPFWPIDTAFYVEKESIDELRFTYYLLKSLGLEHMNSDSAVPGLNRENAHSLTIKIPEQVQDRKALGAWIAKFDKKIELNRQINQTLESMAQAIFKSWFVDFAPVKAKIAALESGEDSDGITRAAMRAISGKTDDELDKMEGGQPDDYARLKTTAGLFPSAMQDSELGEVPEGWKVSTIGEEVGVVGGGTPSTKNPEFWDGGEINWTTPKDLSNLSDKVLLTTDRKITDAGLKKISSGLLPVNTVLMSSRAPVGYLALAKVPVAINQGYIAMLCDKRLSPEFVIQWCNSVMDEIKQRSSGTTFAEISKKNFKVIQIVVPSEGIQQSYSELASGLYNKITETAMECKNLSEIRDSLLPKLLSGELRIEAK